MKENRLNISKKIIAFIILVPALFVIQFYLFKYGILSPQIKGIQVDIVEGEYIKDIDKYIIKLNKEVLFSTGDYVKLPSYAKNPVVEFKCLDDENILNVQNNIDDKKNTAIITGVKEGITSVAIVKDNRVLKKFNILVVEPKVVDLDTVVDGKLEYVGDSATIKSYIEVDFDRFNDEYNVEYKSSDENILSIKNDKIYAVGVGRATVTASIDSKKKSFSYNIAAKLEDLIVDEKINLEIGESKNIKAYATTTHKNLKTPEVEYRFLENKLPIQRKISLSEDGKIVGLRKGVEKIVVSCGSGKNKVQKNVYIKVNDISIKNKCIENFDLVYFFMDDDLVLNLKWDKLNGVDGYQIYIKDNLKSNNNYELLKKIDQSDLKKKNDTLEYYNGFISEILVFENKKSQIVDYDLYIIGYNMNEISKKSKVYNVKIPAER